MPRLELTRCFVDAFMQLKSTKLKTRILNMLDSVELFGGIGSPAVPESLMEEYGSGLRKIAVTPFDLLYIFDEENDVAYIEALVHQKQAR